jgi:hypothetical protein
MQLPTKKKPQSKVIGPRFHSKKTILVAIIVVIILLFFTHNYFLSDQNSPLSNKKGLLTTSQEIPSDQESIVAPDAHQSESNKNDIFLVQLDLKIRVILVTN